ncbi:MAG TPA: VTT domain-containing protein, partial [Crenalkalicoccus sp.]|nr:VTT domain-containing protein [Crenalkalicoccus sp.]
MTAAAAPSRARALVKLLVLAAGLVAAGWVLRSLGAAPGTEWVDRLVRGQGLHGRAVFVLLGAALTAAGVPRQGIAFLGGYAFGAAQGTALGLVAQLLGCAAALGWAGLVGRDWAARVLESRLGRRLRPVREALLRSPFEATLALRLLPVGNNLALNLLAGLAGVPAVPFLAA